MLINKFQYGRIVVDRLEYAADVIIFPDRIRSEWWRREGHELHPDDIDEVLECEPAILVVGLGTLGQMRILPRTEAQLELRGITVIAQRTHEACETYNRLEAGKQLLVAVLHIHC